jgi:hypothetical protein
LFCQMGRKHIPHGVPRKEVYAELGISHLMTR